MAATYTFFINKQTVDIRYTLYENIQLNSSNQSGSENVQQLVVKNLGNSKAEKIIVNVEGKVINYELVKYSESDKEESFEKSDRLQIIYPELPPQGIFKIIIKCDGREINKDDISIRHSKGVAVEALSTENKQSSLLSKLLLLLIYVIVIIYMIRASLIDRWERKSRYKDDYSEILKKRSSPFYISDRAWLIIRKESITTMLNTIRNDYSREIETSICYKLLSNEKPEYLEQNEWTSLLKDLNAILEEKINNKIVDVFFKYNDFEKILKLDRPQYFNQNRWNDIRNEVIKKMIVELENSIYYSTDLERCNIYMLLSSDKLEYFYQNEWNGFSEKIIKSIENNIKERISQITFDVEKILVFFEMQRPQEYPLIKWNDLMSEIYEKYILLSKQNVIAKRLYLENKNLIKELKRKKPDRLPSKYWDEYIDYIKKIYNFNTLYEIYNKGSINLEEQLVEYLDNFNQLQQKAYYIKLINYYINIIEKVNYKEFIDSNKPNWIEEEDYSKLQKYLKDRCDLKVLIHKNKEKEQKLKIEEIEFLLEKDKIRDLKEHVTYQLEILNDVLSDKTILQRIEKYNNVFAKGNFENLVRIANLLNKNQ